MIRLHELDGALLRLERHGRNWRIALVECDANRDPMGHIRAAAFSRLRQDGSVPKELIDLVEGYRDGVLVQILGRKEAHGLTLTIKKVGKPTKSGGALPASEALAFFLRIILRELKSAERKKKGAPVRKFKLIPRSAIGEIALDLLASCEVRNHSPGALLTRLLRELLDLDYARGAATAEKVAFIVAQKPDISTQELARMLHINPGTISRCRRSSAFKQSLSAWTKVLRQMELDGRWPPRGDVESKTGPVMTG